MSLQRYVFYLDSARKMGENFEKQYIFKLLPLQGALLTAGVPRVLPWEGTEKVPSWVMLV